MGAKTEILRMSYEARKYHTHRRLMLLRLAFRIGARTLSPLARKKADNCGKHLKCIFLSSHRCIFECTDKVSHNKPCFPLAKKKETESKLLELFLCVHCSDTSSKIPALLRTFFHHVFTLFFMSAGLRWLEGVKNVGTWKNTLLGAEAFSDAVVEVACECRWKSRCFSLLTLSQSRTNNLTTATQTHKWEVEWRGQFDEQIKESDNSLHTVDISSARRVDIWDLFYMFTLFVRLCRTSCRCITSSEHKTHNVPPVMT